MDVSADSPADNRADDRADGRWMTLKELAEARRISVASAARLMRRRRWRRQPGNDGHIRVLVPAGEQEPKADDRPDRRPDVTTETRPDVLADIRVDVMEVIRPLQDAIAVLEAQLTEANARAARAEQTVADERVRADSRADILRDKIEALQVELRKAEEAAASLTESDERAKRAVAEAEEARQAVEARLASVEGEAAAKVAQTEAAADQARGVALEAVQAAETLRATIDELRAGQTMVRDRYTRELEQARAATQAAEVLLANRETDLAVAQHDAQAAQQAAGELRRTEEARKARGRLRRAWDGWRGR